MSNTTYRLELYNLIVRPGRTKYGSPHITNGWYVARVLDGCRCGQKDFKDDEQAARQHLADLQSGQATW